MIGRLKALPIRHGLGRRRRREGILYLCGLLLQRSEFLLYRLLCLLVEEAGHVEGAHDGAAHDEKHGQHADNDPKKAITPLLLALAFLFRKVIYITHGSLQGGRRAAKFIPQY